VLDALIIFAHLLRKNLTQSKQKIYKMNNQKRLLRSIRRLNKASIRLRKAKEERIWIQNSPQIHILNYPFYKIKRLLMNKD